MITEMGRVSEQTKGLQIAPFDEQMLPFKKRQ
jgi:hypothetical protein